MPSSVGKKLLLLSWDDFGGHGEGAQAWGWAEPWGQASGSLGPSPASPSGEDGAAQPRASSEGLG